MHEPSPGLYLNPLKYIMATLLIEIPVAIETRVIDAVCSENAFEQVLAHGGMKDMTKLAFVEEMIKRYLLTQVQNSEVKKMLTTFQANTLNEVGAHLKIKE